jgi:hypothetical protein
LAPNGTPTNQLRRGQALSRIMCIADGHSRLLSSIMGIVKCPRSLIVVGIVT